jgi:hypothetical protein
MYTGLQINASILVFAQQVLVTCYVAISMHVQVCYQPERTMCRFNSTWSHASCPTAVLPAP